MREFCFSTLALTVADAALPSIRFAAQRRIENSLQLQELVLFRGLPAHRQRIETALERESPNPGDLAIFELGCRGSVFA